MVYAKWEYYSQFYGTVGNEKEFNRLAHRASRKLDILTARRSQTATGYKAEALQDACCNMLDYMQAVECSALGKGITSVSNDGYTESYGATTPEQIDEALRSIAFQWLSGTGLMGALSV